MYLRCANTADAPAFWMIANDPVTKLYDQAATYGRKYIVDLEREIEPWERGWGEKMRAALLAVVDDDGWTIGRAEVTYFQNPKYAEIAYYLIPDRRGRGLGADLVGLLVAYCHQRGYCRIDAAIDPNNEASIRCCLRNGFVHVPREDVTDRHLYRLDM